MNYRCWAEIDKNQLLENLHLIHDNLPSGMKLICVVKADAYGHGMDALTETLIKSKKADILAVANVEEAESIRRHDKNIPIYILSATLPEEEKKLFEYKLIPTISTEEELLRLEKQASQAKQELSVQLKIDTGMGRLGIWHTKALDLYQKVRTSSWLKIVGLYTHFSSADADIPYSEKQKRRFLNFLEKIPLIERKQYTIHAHNSAGFDRILLNPPFNAIRIGLLLFGVRYRYSLLETNVKVKPILSFHTKVCLTKYLSKNTPISYGKTHILKKDTHVAILGAGYGDGIPVSLSNRGQVLIHSQRCPILGRVTMDQIVVDISHIKNVKTGDIATLIGQQGPDNIDIHEVSQWAQTIPWEILCALSKRVHRAYKHDDPLTWSPNIEAPCSEPSTEDCLCSPCMH